MLLKSVLIDGVTKIVPITEMTFNEFLLDKYQGDEATIRSALKKDGLKPSYIDKEIDKLKKDFLRYCNEFSLKEK
ncbi:hypothetical protein CM240_2621 [Clostridium bornimense]|uniref:Uncharacterized protein n=1 Tax=Clostridium bornimense TaxID=1216932 RepID=W6SJ90_9CLOT|nr:hypothetical protein [Clostridium bornimense]CDM69745.1 hypothetical protein CM240_2621 [Clostridium bornimense]